MPGSGLTPGNSQNVPEARTPRNSSNFPIKEDFFNTERYAECTPFLAFEGVKNDKIPIRSSHEVMSYTLKSPLMQNIIKYKDLFSVPMEAILPLNWEKFFDNPVRGDDVLPDVGPTVENFWSKVRSVFNYSNAALQAMITDASVSQTDFLEACFRFLVIFEYFYSNGNLLSTLDNHGSPYFRYTTLSTGVTAGYDEFFDDFVAVLLPSIDNFTFVVDSLSYTVDPSAKPYTIDNKYPLRHFLSLLRDNPTGRIQAASFVSGSDIKTDVGTFYTKFGLTLPVGDVPLNLSRLWAYQLCCSAFYSNDHVDYIYSAELFRQLIGNYMHSRAGSSFSTIMFFTRNGVKYQYDYLSAHVFTSLIGAVNSNSSASTFLLGSSHQYLSGYLSALFGFRRSLKYMDYFAGSRTSPLAVGTNTIPVVGNAVDVIDVTKNIAYQRFRNAVNRVPHFFEGYLKGIFGGKLPAPDYHNPFHLATVADSIFGDETQNTGDAQINPNGQSEAIAITTNLRGGSSKYLFEFTPDRPSIVIGITRYDVPRVHTSTVNRHWFHLDRYDMFNPFFQYTGDQPVYLQELGVQVSSTSQLKNFAYSLKYMEYKQKYAFCAGGFVNNLPGWIFQAVDRRGSGDPVLNPEWIRSIQSEFDEFFTRLTGFSLGSYFHFIVANHNDLSGTRPMAYAPEILS